MLFRTVYGPELEAIYHYVVDCNAKGTRPAGGDVQIAFIAHQPDGDLPSKQSVDDALAFLESARMLEEMDGYHAREMASKAAPFAVQVLEAMRRLEKGAIPSIHAVDPLYTLLLTEVFIKPDRLFVTDLHGEANQLGAVQEAGGLSKEKIGAWKRVMTFLGVGRRLQGGFQCIYNPSLVRAILPHWNERQGTLQSFLEDCFARFLPYAKADGGLSQAVRAPLRYLAEHKVVDLFPLQDSPSRSYFGRCRYKGVAWKGDDDGDH